MTDNYEGQRLVTLAMIDKLHQVRDGSASKSFRENREQFVEGEDFFSGDSGECLFTESGYVKIIWPFDDDLSWQVHREFVNSYMRSRETAKEVQTVEQFSLDMIHNDPATLRAALLNYTESGETAKPHLKVRELPVADREGIDRGLQEADLGRIASELGQLAAALEPEEAAVELKLREEYISAERRLFLTRLERGQVLAGYKALYGPLRKWSAFCKIVNLPRQTAYDLLTVAGEVDRTVSVQSPRAGRRAKKQMLTMIEAVDRAAVAVERILVLLAEQDRANALDKLVERLTSTYLDAKADRKAA